MVQQPRTKQAFNELKRRLKFYPANLKNDIYFKIRKPNENKSDIVISLTSFPLRMDAIVTTLKGLLNQSLLPEHINLYVNRDQYENSDLNRLKSIDRDLIKIKFVDEDYRSYNKLIYAITSHPDKTIVTCDDDVIYPTNWLASLVAASKQNPSCIIATRARQMKHDGSGNLTPYASWQHANHSKRSLSLLPLGVGGVLYPANSLNNSVSRSDLFMNLCPKADDLWFKVMSFLNRTPVVQVSNQPSRYPDVPIGSSPSLASYNIAENGNDEQLNKLLSYFRISPAEFADER